MAERKKWRKTKEKHVNNAENKGKHNIRAKISLNNDCDIERKSKQKKKLCQKDPRSNDA